MTNKEKNDVRKLQSVLIKINDGVRVFFNVSQFEKLGLVVSKKKWGVDSSGNKIDVGYTFHLTSKAKSFINVVI